MRYDVYAESSQREPGLSLCWNCLNPKRAVAVDVARNGYRPSSVQRNRVLSGILTRAVKQLVALMVGDSFHVAPFLRQPSLPAVSASLTCVTLMVSFDELGSFRRRSSDWKASLFF